MTTTEQRLRALILEADNLFQPAIHAAGKMKASLIRGEVSPRAEFENLADARDAFFDWRKRAREALAAAPEEEGWVRVPRVQTPKMQQAGLEWLLSALDVSRIVPGDWGPSFVANIWAAMVQAVESKEPSTRKLPPPGRGAFEGWEMVDEPLPPPPLDLHEEGKR